MPSPTKIGVIAELERVGWDFDWAGDDGVKVRCPFHDDKHASAVLTVSSGAFKCFTADCGKKTDFIGFLAGVTGAPKATVEADLGTRYDLTKDKLIDPSVVERAHGNLPKARPLVAALHDRGLTDATIREFRLGEDRGRITIPIKNGAGEYVNIRRYSPGASGNEKIRNTRGHGQLRLYPIAELGYDKIVLTGGEIKALAGRQFLRAAGETDIGCLTPTGGEGNWSPAFTPLFKGKIVWIVLDIDKPGKVAAIQYARLLSRVADWVGIVELKLDPEEWPHGGLDDFLASGGDLPAALTDCPEFIPINRDASLDLSEEAHVVNLSKACSAESSGKRLKVGCVVTALDQAPYVVPSQVTVDCSRDTNFCALCPVYNEAADKVYSISPEGPAVLAMVGSAKINQQTALAEAIGIPRRCTIVDFEPIEFFNCEDVRVSPRLDLAVNTAERDMLPAITVGLGMELNATYEMVGRMYPHPHNQRSTLVISSYKQARDALTSYEHEPIDELKIFQGHPSEALPKVYEDLETNVTRIYRRRPLHIVADLAFHSPLWLNFDGRQVKGWAEVLIAGDSSQGKSEVINNLMHHYGVGTKVECKNATVAGLLGGCEQIGGKWFVKWGVIPVNDRRLVTLEELKGASRSVIGRLTEMRSSGIAETSKIERRRTHARTRLIALSNPRSDMPVASYNYGIEILVELIGGLEDIRRFDAAIIVARNEVNPEELNKLTSERPAIPHIYTSDLCRKLVLWAWTRTADHVKFSKETETAVLNAANTMCEIFSDRVPLVDRGSQRNKIARLAAALAARLYSTEDGHDLIVKPEHVEYVVKFLTEQYSTSAFGYRQFSEALRAATTMKDPETIKQAIADSPFPKDLVDQLLHTTDIQGQDIQDWCMWDFSSAQKLISLLVRKRAIERKGRSYRKTPSFIEFLRSESVDPSIEDRPDHVLEEEF